MHSPGKAVNGPKIIEKLNLFYDEMKITDKCTFPDGLLWGNKKITCKNLGQYRYCLIT
jgi:hypothetical protein